MEEVKMWKSSDGVIHATEDACRAWEETIRPRQMAYWTTQRDIYAKKTELWRDTLLAANAWVDGVCSAKGARGIMGMWKKYAEACERYADACEELSILDVNADGVR